MKKNIHIILIGILIAVSCLGLAACTVDVVHTHTMNADDDNCSTAITCSECKEVMVAAKVHAPDENWSNDGTDHWKSCINAGCTAVITEKAIHTPSNDDSDCSTAVTCYICQGITSAEMAHSPNADWITDGTNHWKSCTTEGCSAFAIEKTSHTPSKDDRDCSTPLTCSICQAITTAAISHSPNANWSNDETDHWKSCINIGCTTFAVKKTSHTYKNGSNVCDCGYIDVSIFRIMNGTLSNCLPAAYTSITIPDSVTSIGDHAFAAFNGCSGLTSITLPVSMTSIGNNAFNECTELTSITVAKGNTKYHSVGNSIIETATKTLIFGCKTSVIPTDGSVIIIGDKAFQYCSRLADISIPDSIISIGVSAFENCSELTSITIPSSVTNIGVGAFSGCTGLTSITIPFVGGSKDGTSNTHFGYIFGASGVVTNSKYVPASLKTVVITGGTIIAQWAFVGCSGLTNITIPDSVISIDNEAFNACSGLTNITIPDSVTSIGDKAFIRCSGLTGITFGNSVTNIGSSAFSGCSGLTSITIPDSVTNIGGYAFSECSGLTIYVVATTPPIGWASNWNGGIHVNWGQKAPPTKGEDITSEISPE